MADKRSDAAAQLAVETKSTDREAMLHETGTWAATVLVFVGALLVAAAVVPAIVSGPTNPFAALGLVVLGLGAFAGACAVEAYGLARRYATAPVATFAAVVACVPLIAPLFQPGGGDLTLALLWMVLLALVTLLVRRSQATWILMAVTTLPILGLLGLSLAD